MSTIFKDKNKLWWFGLFLADIGLGLWIIAIIPNFTIPVLNLLSANDLGVLGDVGLLAFQFALGFGSAVTIGWGFATMAVALNLTRESRQYLVLGMIVWYVLDGIASFLSQFYLNIASNTLLLLSALYVIYKTELSDN